ncbi:type III restriction endonuclease subunit R [Halomicronema hongdechloris C2206]|uniref:Type III restriction endonuclease subunit R n=1 Tax=Halomicronema hongdechloris C2206 TaxID=1641165 RepID=A0A1Z3HJV0_9CYAN|nr:DEAD/DEAH box helicase [Halomicronema hongdechloris]ASC70536.1 type III restriction endonuclease subunit R [Halomicronema hongdechloris C2206]
MAILHGSWLTDQKRFCIWGETWRRVEAMVDADASPHPLAMTALELLTLLESWGRSDQAQAAEDAVMLPASVWETLRQQATQQDQKSSPRQQKRGKSSRSKTHQDRWITPVMALPTDIHDAGLSPRHSADPPKDDTVLYPWQVAGVWLTPEETMSFLVSLPLGSSLAQASPIGGDLRYWSHVARWALDLMGRGKFLPAVTITSQAMAACWELVLESAVDQERLRQFSQRLPLACRSQQLESDQDTVGVKVELPPPPESVLMSFLQTLVDARVRAIAKDHPLPSTSLVDPELPVKEWLATLAHPDGQLDANPVGASRLRDALQTWTAPLQSPQAHQAARFRPCFRLTPPSQTNGEAPWQLSYGLQLATNAEWYLPAEVIWHRPVDRLHYQGEVITAPQELLLRGLGRAARLYEPIRASLGQQQPTACSLTSIQAYEFIKSTAWVLQDNGFNIVLPPGLTDSGDSLNSRLGLRIQAQAPARRQRQRLGLKSLLDFKWELSIAGETLSQQEFENLITQGSPLVQINDRWVELRPQDVRAAQTFLQQSKADLPLSVEDALRISTGDTQVINKLPVVDFEASGALKSLIDTLTTGNQTLEPVAEPAGFQGQLRPYQAWGISWLAFLEQWGLGACLADDMGLGKTIQLIAFLLYLRQQDLLEAPTLLVCPTSVLGNWEREVKRFAPDLKTLVYHGDKRPHGTAFTKAAKAVQMVITSYPLVKRDLRDLKRVEWQGLVLDEAQNIKNPEAKQSKAVRELEAQFRIALTGTPVENRLAELWSIMDFLNPGYLGPRNFFQRRFATPIERYGDTASLSTLRSLVRPFILRRLKTDRSIIADLPEKQEMTVFCGLSSEQAALYQQVVEDSMASLEETDGIQRHGLILALLTKLKQICNHPAQFLQESAPVQPARSGKLQRLDEMLEEVISAGDRTLIFTQFAEMGKQLRTHLERQFGQEALFLYGSTSKAQREAMVDRFQHDPDAPRLFILSLKAGGVGLNLTRANHVFHFDRWWNPAVENQATDRVFRIGQTQTVQVHKFVCTGTLEERIHEMIESKQTLSEQVVGTGEQWLTELDTDSLRQLLLLDRQAIMDT